MSPTLPRQHDGDEPLTLGAYRNRHALYKIDAHLQSAHGAFPWLVVFDDHEVENNWASDFDQNGTAPELFLPRRAGAFKAYYEHMPLRASSIPRGPDIRLYRRIRFGDLAEINMLDTRQYRDDQACGDGTDIDCAAALDPVRTITGREQERWLLRGLDHSRARRTRTSSSSMRNAGTWCDLTHRRCHAEFKTMPYVTSPGAPITTRASFTVLSGEPGLLEGLDS